MATKTIQIILLDRDLDLEIEAEETMTFQGILTRLSTLEYIKPDLEYYIKTQSGVPIKGLSSVGSVKYDVVVITENPNWKSSVLSSASLSDIPEVISDIILHENKYWLIPLFSATSWDDDELLSQLFCLNNINAPNNRKLSINVVVQYSHLDPTLLGSKLTKDRTEKMRQILRDSFDIEIMVNNISENNFYENIKMLCEKAYYYLASHMELQWGTKVTNVSIVGFREYDFSIS